DPQGVTAILIIGASHLSIHSWPEHKYASADLVVCTEGFVLQEVIDLIRERVHAKQVNFIEFRRGLIEAYVHTHAD
ncbi:MAG: S-adenosylmethionine decarboxylase, partial [Anaerolinea sp.]|nr:S-adenosylmethionine decarboxylase [Anaerolinea sp.]